MPHESLDVDHLYEDIDYVCDYLEDKPVAYEYGRDALHCAGAACSSFEPQVDYNDIAVTADGRLLLAAKQRGLREYDGEGRELSCWLPAERRPNNRDEQVTVVDALDDGRAAAGVHYAHYVALLRRLPADADPTSSGFGGGGSKMPSSWLEERRISALKSPPYQLSSHGGILLAVAECRWRDDMKQWWPGPELLLANVCCGCELSRQRLDYNVQSLAVTARVVVTLSWGKVRLGDGREQYIVDGHSHGGERLWRRQQDDEVWDVCSAPASQVLYLALPASDRVMAVSADTGRRLTDVLSGGSRAPIKPGRVSAKRGCSSGGGGRGGGAGGGGEGDVGSGSGSGSRVDGGQRTVLAMSSADWKTVIMYSFKDPATTK